MKRIEELFISQWPWKMYHKEWQTINRLDPRRCVPALKELDGMLKVSYSGEVCYGV